MPVTSTTIGNLLAAMALCLWLYLPEMGVKGPAFVRSVEACPAIAEGDDADSRVVTATFRAKLGVPWTLRVDGVEEPIRVTGDHHVWSEDRLAWVRVNELEPGERSRSGASSCERAIVPGDVSSCSARRWRESGR